jgi:hypothetical protein
LSLAGECMSMKRLPWILGAAICAGALTGCVERRYVVYTDPPGALVLRNGTPIGQSPADDHFVYYGKYHFTLIKEGYETQQIEQIISTPWYEYFPLDFISENLIPWPIRDRRTFSYQLEPRRLVDTNELRKQAENLRNRGRSLGAGTQPEPAAPAVPPAPMPPAP